MPGAGLTLHRACTQAAAMRMGASGQGPSPADVCFTRPRRGAPGLNLDSRQKRSPLARGPAVFTFE
jgi:hypothetical protein